jgi:competence protein ComEA
MPSTPAERRALAVVAAIAALGIVARAVKARQASPAPTEAQVLALDSQIARVRAARGEPGRGKSTPARTTAAGKSRTTSQSPRDTARPPLIDLDTASVSTLEALPWVGPSLAARIVESRERCGPFGSIEELKRVYGIGDGMAKRLTPYVTFSMPSRPTGADLATACSKSAKGAAPRRRGRS